jgi:hypothetical protein
MAGMIHAAADRRGKGTSLHFACERATLFLRRQVLGEIRGCDKAGGYLVFEPTRATLRPSLALAGAPTHVQVWTRVQGGVTCVYDVTGGSVFEGRLHIRTPARSARRVPRAEVSACPQGS